MAIVNLHSLLPLPRACFRSKRACASQCHHQAKPQTMPKNNLGLPGLKQAHLFLFGRSLLIACICAHLLSADPCQKTLPCPPLTARQFRPKIPEANHNRPPRLLTAMSVSRLAVAVFPISTAAPSHRPADSLSLSRLLLSRGRRNRAETFYIRLGLYSVQSVVAFVAFSAR